MPNVQIGSASSPYENLIQNASSKYGVPANLIKAVIKQESGGKATVVSNKGAGGLMQLMPKTAASLGVTNVYDPAQNIDAGTRYLAAGIKNNNGSIPLALAAYNAGQGRVNQAGGQIPNIPETQNYVKNIMAMYGGGNIDLSAIGGTGSNPFDIGGNIVNGIQNIFKTLFTDTVKVLLYVILFALMIFFGYKALQGSPPVNAAGSGAKKAIKTIVKVIPK